MVSPCTEPPHCTPLALAARIGGTVERQGAAADVLAPKQRAVAVRVERDDVAGLGAGNQHAARAEVAQDHRTWDVPIGPDQLRTVLRLLGGGSSAANQIGIVPVDLVR